MDAVACELARHIDSILPQTQCTRCGYPDCRSYAEAIATGGAAINQCPPGGSTGVERLAAVTGMQATALDPTFGIESARNIAYIDEAWCIGCTLCVKVCPTDAIIGTNKRMHTVLEHYCTGCDLCLPACPVDCIIMENASGTLTGWQAWSVEAAHTARTRYAAKKIRQQRELHEHQERLELKALAKLADLPAHSQHSDPAVLAKKRAVIEAALERARKRRAPSTPESND